jgi:hypothetical protein
MWAMVFERWVCYLDNMKHGGKAVVWLGVSLALTTGTMARTNNSSASSDGPYRAIVDRNVFDLRPQPVTPPVTAPATPPPNVKLVGLMTISGHPQGVFSVADQSAPSKQPVTYILSADQRQASLEVKSIDMAAQSARVQIGQDITVLKLVDEPKGPAAAGPAAAPGMAAGGGQRPFPAGGRAGGRPGFPMPAPGGGFTPAGAYSPTPSASYSPGVSPDGGTGVLPTRPVRTDTTADQNPPMTAEQQIVAIEQAREAYSQNNDPRALIMPPTQLTSALQAQLQAAGMQTGNTGGGPPPIPSGGPPSLPMGARTTGSLSQ